MNKLKLIQTFSIKTQSILIKTIHLQKIKQLIFNTLASQHHQTKLKMSEELQLFQKIELKQIFESQQFKSLAKQLKMFRSTQTIKFNKVQTIYEEDRIYSFKCSGQQSAFLIIFLLFFCDNKFEELKNLLKPEQISDVKVKRNIKLLNTIISQNCQYYICSNPALPASFDFGQTHPLSQSFLRNYDSLHTSSGLVQKLFTNLKDSQQNNLLDALKNIINNKVQKLNIHIQAEQTKQNGIKLYTFLLPQLSQQIIVIISSKKNIKQQTKSQIKDHFQESTAGSDNQEQNLKQTCLIYLFPNILTYQQYLTSIDISANIPQNSQNFISSHSQLSTCTNISKVNQNKIINPINPEEEPISDNFKVIVENTNEKDDKASGEKQANTKLEKYQNIYIASTLPNKISIFLNVEKIVIMVVLFILVIWFFTNNQPFPFIRQLYSNLKDGSDIKYQILNIILSNAKKN